MKVNRLKEKYLIDEKAQSGGMNVIKTHPSLPWDDRDEHADPRSASGLMVMKTPAVSPWDSVTWKKTNE